MPFGSARSVHTRADMPHCMSFSNKACFHGDHLSPYCATFYGGRARNVSAVIHPIFKIPGFGWIWMNLIYFLVYIVYMLITWTISCIIKNVLVSIEDRALQQCFLTKMRTDCWDLLPLLLDLSLGISFTPLSFFSQHLQEIFLFPLSHFLEIMSSLWGVLALLTVLRWVSC